MLFLHAHHTLLGKHATMLLYGNLPANYLREASHFAKDLNLKVTCLPTKLFQKRWERVSQLAT